MSDNLSSDDPAKPAQRLDSWKDIASYLKRDVSTVQRWEKREGMPVHRHVHDRIGSVYAFPAEIDAWWQSRQKRLHITEAPDSVEPVATPRNPRRMLWIAVAVAAVAAGVLVFRWFRLDSSPDNPLANARFIRLTDFEGKENAAAISRDGRFVAFLGDRSGPVDVWLTQIGSGQFSNLTAGKIRELVNPDVRTIDFSPDATLVAMWTRGHRTSQSKAINIWAVPTLGGEPRIYLENAAEFDWSSDGKRVVYHTVSSGDPMFVSDDARRDERELFTGPPGHHSHFPVWSPDDAFIYFVHGPSPDAMDVCRIRADGGEVERLTSHNSRVSNLAFLDKRTLAYLATDSNGGGPWIYALDVDRKTSRRISFGVERYTSLTSSADGRRIAATVASSNRSFWRAPITDSAIGDSDATQLPVPTGGGRFPRVGPGYLLYVSSKNDGEAIWKFAEGSATELWSAPSSRVVGGPAIASDGMRIAFTAEQRGRAALHLVNADGSSARVFPESLVPASAPAWSPDGRTIVVAALIQGTPHVVAVSVDKGTLTPLIAGIATDPAWSTDGRSIVYSQPDAGPTQRVHMIGADGTVQPVPDIVMDRGSRRIAFVPGRRRLIVLRGERNRKNFWIVDLDTGHERPLTNFSANQTISDFDCSPDGREIVFDREVENSDVVLIENRP